MTMPTWWEERRFGICVHASLATVPAWAPVGASAHRYRTHLEGESTDDGLHSGPLVEVIAHHRDRWDHIAHYDDFAPLLSYADFDADEWARLISGSGAGYAVLVAKDLDGWTWWDAPDSARSLTRVGPRRNVLAEFAAACERNDLVFGTACSPVERAGGLGSADVSDDVDVVDDAVRSQVVDLVERFGTSYVRGAGHSAPDATHPDAASLVERIRAVDPEVVIDDHWSGSASEATDGAPGIVATYEQVPPDEITDGPWELTRTIGHGHGFNRNEQPEHHMTGFEIVDVLCEVVAKGGHLTISVGPTADGTIPAAQVAPLTDAGSWIRRHRRTLAQSTPWTRWGDHRVRYLDAPDGLVVVDVGGSGTFEALDRSSFRVTAVTIDGTDGAAVEWTQDDAGLHVATPPIDADVRIGIVVYRVALDDIFDVVEPPGELFAPVVDRPTELGPLLAGAAAGDIVQLGDGTYLGPASVPIGVTVRGLGPGRTTITSPASSVTAGPTTVLTLDRDARVEHMAVTCETTDSGPVASPLVTTRGARSCVLGCTIDGSIEVEADDVLVRAVTARGIVATNSDRLHVSRCHFEGNRRDVGVDLRGGGGHEIESNEFADHLCAVRATETTGSTIRGNTIAARWWGVHLDHSEDSHVHANRVSDTMRAVAVDGGAHAVVDGNAVTNGDSGCVVEDGAAGCEVYGNHWDRCRVGLLAWGATGLHHQDNVCSGLHDQDGAFTSGP